MTTITRKNRRAQRKRRIRSKIMGSSERPRLSIFRSHKHLYVQLVDDTKGTVLASFSSRELDAKGKKGEIAKEIGRRLAQKAKEQKVETIVFDRSGYKYQGHVKALAEEMRAQGIVF